MKIVFIPTEDIVKAIIFNNIVETIVSVIDNTTQKEKDTPCPILDTSAGHNKVLVDAINKAYFKGNHLHFQMIIYMLYMRDYEECVEKGLEIPTSPIQVTNTHIEWYLRRIADDLDLHAILGFMRQF